MAGTVFISNLNITLSLHVFLSLLYTCTCPCILLHVKCLVLFTILLQKVFPSPTERRYLYLYTCTISYCIWLLNFLYVQFTIVYMHYTCIHCTYTYICIYSSGRNNYCPSTLKDGIQVATFELNSLSTH